MHFDYESSEELYKRFQLSYKNIAKDQLSNEIFEYYEEWLNIFSIAAKLHEWVKNVVSWKYSIHSELIKFRDNLKKQVLKLKYYYQYS